MSFRLLFAFVLVCASLVLSSAHAVHSGGKNHPALHRRTPTQSTHTNTQTLMQAWKQRAYSQLLSPAPTEVEADGTLPWAIGENSYTIARPEGQRSWYLYIPTTFNSQYNWTLVLALHGLGDEAREFVSDTNMTGLAEAEGFLLLYPQGSTGMLGTGWNAGTCCVGENIDDIGFISAIIELVLSNLPIRPDSVHSLGFSNGGFMTESIGCHNSTLFKSIASVSGNTILVWGPQQALAACDALFQSPTSILHVHGNADLIVPWDGDELLGWGTIPADLAAWAARNKCPNAPINTFNISTFSDQLWQGCGPDGAYEVQLVLNQGGGHVWPQIPGVFDVSDVILQFWTRVTPGGLTPVPA